MQKIIWLLLAIMALFAVSMALRNRRSNHRQSTLRATLDAADALESEIRAARTALQSADFGTTDAEDALDTAMRDLLNRRLWLQSHAATASTETLESRLAEMQDAILRMRQFSTR